MYMHMISLDTSIILLTLSVLDTLSSQAKLKTTVHVHIYIGLDANIILLTLSVEGIHTLSDRAKLKV